MRVPLDTHSVNHVLLTERDEAVRREVFLAGECVATMHCNEIRRHVLNGAGGFLAGKSASLSLLSSCPLP